MKNNNRRNFLKKGMITGATLITTSALGATKSDTGDAGRKRNSIPLKSKMRVLGSGSHAIEVSALGMGCMGMSYHRSFIPDKKAMITVMRRAADLGVNFFDTAEAYGPFVNEELVGEGLQPIRKNVLIATKFSVNEILPRMHK